MTIKFKIRKPADLLYPENWSEEVEGESLSLPEYPTLRFFIREQLISDYYEVTEAKTGMLVYENFGKGAVLKRLKELIERVTLAKIEKKIADRVKIFGGELNKVKKVEK